MKRGGGELAAQEGRRACWCNCRACCYEAGEGGGCAEDGLKARGWFDCGGSDGGALYDCP